MKIVLNEKDYTGNKSRQAILFQNRGLCVIQNGDDRNWPLKTNGYSDGNTGFLEIDQTPEEFRASLARIANKPGFAVINAERLDNRSVGVLTEAIPEDDKAFDYGACHHEGQQARWMVHDLHEEASC